MDVRMPDGVLVKNVPEGTTQEDLLERYGDFKSSSVNRPTSVANQLSAQRDIAPPVDDAYSRRYNPQQSTLGYVGNQLGQALSGILGLPGAALEQEAKTGIGPLSVVSRLGRGIQQTLGIPSVPEAARSLGIQQDMRAPGPGTEALTGMGVDVAQNLAFPGGTVAQKVASGVGSYLGRNAGAAAGTGGEAAGSIFGGVVAPAFFGARLGALSSVKDFIKGSPEELQTRIRNNPEMLNSLRTRVVNEIADSLRQDPDAYAAKYAAAQDLEKAIPGLQLNLGQRFMAPSVLQQQRALETSSPAEMNAAASRRSANEAALRGAIGEQPGARQSAGAALTGMNKSISERSRSISDEIARVSDEASSISNRVARRVDLEDIGQRALDVRQTELASARAKANDLMGLASRAAQEEKAAFDISPLVERAKTLLKDPVWDDANTTSIFGKIKGVTGEEPKVEWNPITGSSSTTGTPPTVGFDDIREMRQAVNADIASALRSNSPNARSQLRNLTQLKSEIDNVIESSPFQNTRDAYSKFVEYYRSEFAPRFLRGANLMAEKRTSLGEPRLPPEKVFNAYLKPGGATEMSRYLRLYGQNTDAMSAMRDAVTDRYAKEVVKDGLIDPAAHARFLDRYKLPLATLDRAGFKFGNEFNDNAKAFAAVNDRLSALRNAAEVSDKDAVRKLISDDFGTRTPEDVVSTVMSDPRKMAALLSRADQSQRRGIVEFIKDDMARSFSSDKGVSADAIEAFLKDGQRSSAYKVAMSQAYSPEVANAQLKTLKDIADAARRLEATPIPASAAVQGKPSIFKDELQRKTGLSIAVVGNMVRAVITGRVSPEWAALALGSQAGATVMQQMKNEIYKEIIRDPKSAQMLLHVMRGAPESTGTLAATTQLLRKIPHLASYFVGADKYPRYGLYSGANAAREMSLDQNSQTVEAQ